MVVGERGGVWGVGRGGGVEEPSEGSVRVGGALECRLDAAGGEVADV